MSLQYAPPSPPEAEAFGPPLHDAEDEIDARDDGKSLAPDRVAFNGSIIAKKRNGGLVLKSTSTQGNVKIDTLTHLPPSATAQLQKSRHGGDLINHSMQGGRESSPVEISHASGKWSIRETLARQPRK